MIYLIFCLSGACLGYYAGSLIGYRLGLLTAEKNLLGFLQSLNPVDRSYWNMQATEYNKRLASAPTKPKFSVVKED